jgi:protein arginine N-methyltransferase 2
MMDMSVLHYAATCRGASGTQTVRWVLNEGVPWNHTNRDGHFPFQIAEMIGNDESATVLKEWAINEGMTTQVLRVCCYKSLADTVGIIISEYEKYYRPPVDIQHLKKLYQLRSVGDIADHQNEAFCKSPILFTNPPGAPDDEVALITLPEGCGVMTEWERPISPFGSYLLFP